MLRSNAGTYRLLPRIIEDELQQPGQRLERPGELDDAARQRRRREALRRVDFLLRSKLLAVRGPVLGGEDLSAVRGSRQGMIVPQTASARLQAVEQEVSAGLKRGVPAGCLQTELPAGMRVQRVRGGQATVAAAGGQYTARLTLVPAPRDDVTLAKYRPAGEPEEAAAGAEPPAKGGWVRGPG